MPATIPQALVSFVARHLDGKPPYTPQQWHDMQIEDRRLLLVRARNILQMERKWLADNGHPPPGA